MRHLSGTIAVAAALLLVSGCTGTAQSPARSAGNAPASPASSLTVVTPGGGTSAETGSRPSPGARGVSVSKAKVKLPSPLARMVVIGSGPVAIVAGGMVSGDESTARSYRLDPVRGVIDRLPDLPVPVHDAAGGLIGGRPAVLGGGNAAEQAAVQMLAPDHHWRVAGRLPTTRSDLSVLPRPNGGVWVIGGYDGSSVPRTVLATADGNRFRAVSTLARGVRYAAVASTPSGIWILGGEVNGTELDAVQQIGQRHRPASVVARLPRPLGHAMAVSFGDRILLMGGRSAPHTLTDRMWWFDTKTLRFTSAGTLPTKLADAGVLPAGQNVYLLGGETPAVTRDVLKVTAS